MKQITSITAEPKQRFSVRLDDSSMVNIKLEYSDANRCWFMDINYGGYESTCIQVTNSPNILRQIKNLYNFGIGCSVTDGTEPWFVDDFITGRASLYVLNKADVDYVEKNIYG